MLREGTGRRGGQERREIVRRDPHDRQQPDALAAARELPGDLEGDHAAETLPCQAVRPSGLGPDDRVHVERRHLLERGPPLHAPGFDRILQRVAGLVGSKVAHDLGPGKDPPEVIVHEKQRRPFSAHTQGHDGRGAWLVSECSRQVGHGGQLAQRSRGETGVECLFHAHGDDGRAQRVASKIAEAVVDAYRPPVEDVFPEGDELRLEVVSGRRELRGSGRGRRQRAPIHLSVGVNRELLEQHEYRGDHHIRKRGGERRSQVIPARRWPRSRRQVRDEPRLPE